jgi:type II secretory pathway component PulJ
MFSRVRRRPGFSLAEVSVALALTVLLGTLLSGLMIAQLRVARSVADHARDADAVRTTRVVLEGEARRMMPEDVRARAADSLSLRAFRGTAVPCDGAGTDLVRVRYRGDRLPDPRKDSVLVIAAAASHSVALIDSRGAAAACASQTGEQVLQWRVSAPLHDAALLLLFESGNYYLSARALRYRLGAEGRQPVTAELFSHPGTRFRPGMPATGIAYTLETTKRRRFELSAPFAWEWRP